MSGRKNFFFWAVGVLLVVNSQVTNAASSALGQIAENSSASVFQNSILEVRGRSGGRATASRCGCGSGTVCRGPRGGRYCITRGGKKRYGV